MARHRLSALWLIGAGWFIELLTPLILPFLIDLYSEYTNDGYAIFALYSPGVQIIAAIIVLSGILWLRSLSQHRALRMCLTGIAIAMVLDLGLLILSISAFFAADGNHAAGPDSMSRIKGFIDFFSIPISYILWIGSFALVRQGLPRNDGLSMKIERIQNIRMIQFILFTISHYCIVLNNNETGIDNIQPLIRIHQVVSLAVAFCFAVYLIRGLHALIRDERFFPRSAHGVADPQACVRPRIVSASAVGALCGCATVILCCMLYATRF